MPQRGDIDYDLIRSAARQGAGAQFQMFAGSPPTTGHIAIYDVNGNVTDGGPPGAAYVLPPATSAILGGVKIGANVSVAADGTISVAAPGGAPAGPANAVQYNNSGAFGGSSYLLWDNTGCTLNISSPAGLGNQGPGIAITDPDNSRSAQIYVNQVGLQIEAGSNTAMYLDSPNHGIQISAGSNILLDSNATVGPAFQFETNASASSLIILPNGYVGINQPSPQYQLGVVGDVNITGQYRINGTPLALGQNQTPWLSDIQAANFNLHNAQGIGVAGSANNLNGITIWGNYQTAGVLHSNSNSAGFAGFEAMGNVGGVAIGAYGSTASSGAGTAIVASVNGIPLTFLTNAVERMRIAGNNTYMGIGTASPQTTLDVNGTVRVLNNVTASSGAGLELLYVTGAQGLLQCYDRGGSAYLPIVFGGSWFNFGVGNVGINTPSPQQKLDVNGVITLQDGGNRYLPAGICTEVGSQLIDIGINEDASSRFGPYVSADQGGLFRVDARAGAYLFSWHGRVAGSTATMTPLMVINSNGTVGIGTPSPGTALDVVGDIRSNDIVYGDRGLALNLVNTGSNWQYRTANPALFIQPYNGIGTQIYSAVSGAAGATASLPTVMRFADNGTIEIYQPLGIAAINYTDGRLSALPNGSVMIGFTSNTQLAFLFRGSDGVLRTGYLGVA